ncbi:ribonuclease P protein component [Glaciihabitans sp. dw_435]|uniref:ribonuclease P protein component n=1 Tax=Glaciihabitans sp. dw_435 TaxID=2720081 RepID=UPI001BD34B91|nr:ribonuclease P protein component [Glaciihabitans sp. dw_435]
MLAKANRVVRADDFRTTVRKGRRVSTRHAVVYLHARSFGEPTRFGFIVAKTVGNAVTRNLMRRRLRSVGRDILDQHSTGTDIVIRALPGSDEVSWATLHDEISQGIDRGVSKR